jgi:tetratricopeptide (TPR) repeat protein
MEFISALNWQLVVLIIIIVFIVLFIFNKSFEKKLCSIETFETKHFKLTFAKDKENENIIKDLNKQTYKIENDNKDIEKNALTFFEKATLEYKNKQFEVALELYNKAIEADIKFSEAYYFRGLTNEALKRFEDAESDYNKVIKIRPYYWKPYFSLGRIKEYFKTYEESIILYEKAISMKPEKNILILLYRKKATLYKFLNEYEKSLDAYYQAVDIEDKKYEKGSLYDHIGECYNFLNDNTKAIINYNKSIKLRPLDSNVYRLKGDSYGLISKPLLAINSYKKAIKRQPNWDLVYICMIRQYFFIGSFENVIKISQDRLQHSLDWAKPSYYEFLFQANWKLGNYYEAEENGKKAIKTNNYLPKNHSIKIENFIIKFKKGNPKKIKFIIKQFIKSFF